MFAGPLCGNLLSLAGLRLVKVESTALPDGARYGPQLFFDLLHSGQESVALDFRSEGDRARLLALLEVADVVIEASRPRALEQLGVHRLDLLKAKPGKVWVSSTGYGSVGAEALKVAFGDDAAATAGLVTSTSEGASVFCGDAIADPLGGLHAAVATLAMLTGGQGGLIDASLCGLVNHTLEGQPTRPGTSRSARRVNGEWVLTSGDGTVLVATPRARALAGHGPDLGEHTEAGGPESGT